MSLWLILAALFGALLFTLPLDAILRRSVWEKEQFAEMQVLAPDGASTTMVVYLPGILASSTMMPERLIKVFAEFGEVWGVNYLSPRFRSERIVNVVTRWLVACCQKDRRINRIIFVGSSMGGLLAYDIHKGLAANPLMKNVRFGLMPIDAPTGAEDLQSPLDRLAPLVRWLPFGPIWNNLSGPFMKLLFIPPKEGEIDPDVDRDWLAQQVEGARSFPLSFWRDQIMYILNHGAPEPDSIGSRLVYIRSTEDNDTVRPEAVLKWFEASDSWRKRSQCLAEDAKHAAYAQNPGAYEKVLPEAFWFLEL